MYIRNISKVKTRKSEGPSWPSLVSAHCTNVTKGHRVQRSSGL